MVRAVLILLALGAILYYLLIIIPEQKTRQENTARDSQLKNDARSQSKTPLIGDQVILDGSGDFGDARHAQVGLCSSRWCLDRQGSGPTKADENLWQAYSRP